MEGEREKYKIIIPCPTKTIFICATLKAHFILSSTSLRRRKQQKMWMKQAALAQEMFFFFFLALKVCGSVDRISE
jgi:hypothetical protein